MQSEAAEGLIMDPQLGGSLMEMWAGGNGLILATITGIQQDYLLELSGRMGRLEAATGFIRFELEERQGATRLRLDHRVVGAMENNAEAACRRGWTELLDQRLRAFVETDS